MALGGGTHPGTWPCRAPLTASGFCGRPPPHHAPGQGPSSVQGTSSPGSPSPAHSQHQAHLVPSVQWGWTPGWAQNGGVRTASVQGPLGILGSSPLTILPLPDPSQILPLLSPLPSRTPATPPCRSPWATLVLKALCLSPLSPHGQCPVPLTPRALSHLAWPLLFPSCNVTLHSSRSLPGETPPTQNFSTHTTM